MDLTLSLILLVVFAATFARSAVGFGDALIGMPLLTLLVGLHTAAPLVGLLSVAMSGVILIHSWRHVELSDTWRLVLASLVGMPVGVWALKSLPEAVVTGGLGLLLVGFGTYSLLRPVLPELRQPRWVYLCGGVAGAFGAAYNTHGPPVVVYGALRRWPPVRFRATMQSFFLPSSVAICLSHGLGGLWNRQVFLLFALSLPALLVAVYSGGWVNRRVPMERFTRLLYWILVGLGGLLLLRAL